MSAVISETGGGVVSVPISHLEGYEQGDPPSDEFIRSVGKRMYHAVLVRALPKRDGDTHPRLLVLDGSRRVKAALANGQEFIDVRFDEGDEDPDKIAMISNYQRNENVTASARRVLAKLEEGMSESDTAAYFEINLARLRGLRDMGKLLPELWQAAEDGRMKSWAARNAARQPESVQNRLIGILHETGKVTPDDVIAERKVKTSKAVTELGDLFAGDLPELGGDRDLVKVTHGRVLDGKLVESDDPDAEVYDEEKVFQEWREEFVTPAALKDPKPKVKISRAQRYENIRSLIAQARKEMLAIKSNVRVDEDVFILGYFDEIDANLDIVTANES